jgi:hypothetical protein
MVDCALEAVSTFLLGVTLMRASGPRCAAVFVVPAIPLSLLLVTLPPGSLTTPDFVIAATRVTTTLPQCTADLS